MTVSPGAVVSYKDSIGEEPTSVLNYIAVRRMQFLEDDWPEILHSLMAVD